MNQERDRRSLLSEAEGLHDLINVCLMEMDQCEFADIEPLLGCLDSAQHFE